MYAELRAALKRNGHYETLRLRERAEQRNRNGSEGECGVMDVESEKSEKSEKSEWTEEFLKSQTVPTLRQFLRERALSTRVPRSARI